jgi:hypothetical protein
MDEEQDGSMGMIIAIVAGGIVLVLIVLGVLGGFVMWRLEEPPMAGPGAVAVFEEARVEVDPMGPIGAEVPPPQAPAPMPVVEKAVSPETKRLLGEWEAMQPDGTKATLFFGVDGRLRLMKQPPGNDAPDSMMLRWELVETKGNRSKVRYVSENKVYDVQQEFEFQGSDRLVIHGPFRENDRWVVKGPDGTATYQRKQ